MNTSVIESLLEKYYEGDTSLQEDEILRKFFQMEDVPVHLKLHKPLFDYFVAEKRHELTDLDFDSSVFSQIKDESTASKGIQMHPKRSRIMFITSIAASLLLVIGLFFTLKHEIGQGALSPADNPNAVTAYADVTETLMFVSGNLNNGLKQVEHLQEVDRVIKELENFSKFYQCQTIIINPDKFFNPSIKSK